MIMIKTATVMGQLQDVYVINKKSKIIDDVLYKYIY